MAELASGIIPYPTYSLIQQCYYVLADLKTAQSLGRKPSTTRGGVMPCCLFRYGNILSRNIPYQQMAVTKYKGYICINYYSYPEHYNDYWWRLGNVLITEICGSLTEIRS